MHATFSSTPSKNETENQMVFNVANLSEIPSNAKDSSTSMTVKEEDDVRATYPCRHCSQSFSSWNHRENHELEHKQNGSSSNHGERLTVPPLILKKSAVGKTRKTRKMQVIPAKDTLHGPQKPEELQVEISPHEIRPRKSFKCDRCNTVYSSFKAKWWHDIKHHKVLMPGEDKRKHKSKQTCRYCGSTFDNYVHKYKHEKRCSEKPAEPAEGDEPPVKAEQSAFGAVEDDTEEFKAKCSKCSEEFSSRRAKTVHEKQVHQMDIRECRVCHKMFSSYPGRYIHEKRCTAQQSQVEA